MKPMKAFSGSKGSVHPIVPLAPSALIQDASVDPRHVLSVALPPAPCSSLPPFLKVQHVNRGEPLPFHILHHTYPLPSTTVLSASVG